MKCKTEYPEWEVTNEQIKWISNEQIIVIKTLSR